jgi:hypothetical protein
MTLMKAGTLILLVVVGAGIAALALSGLGGSTGKEGTRAPQTEMVAQEMATRPEDAPAVATEVASASMETSALAPETAIPPVQAPAQDQVETATFALG